MNGRLLQSVDGGAVQWNLPIADLLTIQQTHTGVDGQKQEYGPALKQR